MKRTGRNTWIVLAVVLVGMASGICLPVLLWGPPGDLSIGMGYYEASAQIIPVLLLAMIVRISTVRNSFWRSLRRAEERRAKFKERFSSRLTNIREELEQRDKVDPELLAEVEVIEKEVAEETPEVPTEEVSKLSELLAGVFIAAFVLGVFGTGTALAALAGESGSYLLFMPTVSSTFWVAFNLAAFEVVYFLLIDSLETD